MDQVLIFPYGGNAVEALECLRGEYEFIGFVDDNTEKQKESENGYKIYSREAFRKFPNAKVIAVPGSVGNFINREKIILGLNLDKDRFISAIHPDASVAETAKVGINVMILAGTVLTANCVLEDNVICLANTVIHHDSIVGQNSIVGSNVVVAGHVQIGVNCYVGSGSNIINNTSVGAKTLVGMGSNVLDSCEPESKLVGNPAKQI